MPVSFILDGRECGVVKVHVRDENVGTDSVHNCRIGPAVR
jgi:hypothetical protein